MRVAQPAALAVWQGLDEHLSVIDRIGLVPAQFGPRNGNFPLIEEYALAENFRLAASPAPPVNSGEPFSTMPGGRPHRS